MNKTNSGLPRERIDLYEDDLTEERGPTPVRREELAHELVLDPEVDSDEPDIVYDSFIASQATAVIDKR